MHESESAPPRDSLIPKNAAYLESPAPPGSALMPETADYLELPPPPSNPLDLGKQVAPWWHTILLVVVLVGISVLGGTGTKKQQLVGHQMMTYISTIILEWILLAYVWWGLRLRRVPLKSLMGDRHKGWRGLGHDLGYAAIFWIMAYFVLAFCSYILRILHLGKAGPPGKVLALAPSTPLDFLMWFLVCVTAGICEELIFRGYLLHQFSSIGGKIWIGVVVSSLIFGASHGYEGAAVMIVIFVYGLLFCMLALKTRTIRPGMIAHGWQDFFTGLAIAALHHFHHL